MPRRKLTDEQVDAVRQRIAAGDTLRNVARDYGGSFSAIRNVAQSGYRGYRNQHRRSANDEELVRPGGEYA